MLKLMRMYPDNDNIQKLSNQKTAYILKKLCEENKVKRKEIKGKGVYSLF